MLIASWALGCSEDPPVGAAEAPVPAPLEDEAQELVRTGYHDEAPTPHEGPEEEPEPTLTEEEAYALFFASGQVQRIRLTLSADARASLDLDPLTWVCVGFTHEDGPYGTMSLPFVGMRLKGSQTFDTLAGKPSIKIDFDGCADGRSYVGLEHLTLNNMASDEAEGREVVAYALWNQAGMPAPRATYAQVWINDEPYGLYTALEGMDRRWVKRRFADAGGDLWEANDDADLSAGHTDFFALSAGVGDVDALEAAAEVIDGAGTDFYAEADTVVAMDGFLDYWAWSMATGNQDGYPYNLNDYFMYADPGDGGRLRFSPWGMDETWMDGWTFSVVQLGAVGDRCLLDPTCRERLAERTNAALDTFEALDAAGQAQAWYDLTDALLDEDPRRPGNPQSVRRAREKLVEHLGGWADKVRGALP